MPNHDYSARDALELLLGKLSGRDEHLGRQIRSAIDAGKDIEERERRGRGQKARVYRKTVPFTPEEALQVAIDALQACFIEQPLFANSVAASLQSSALDQAVPADRRDLYQVPEIPMPGQLPEVGRVPDALTSARKEG